MNNDNYKATGASLADQPEPGMTARPRSVNIALGLIVVTILIPLIATLKALQYADSFLANPRGTAIIAAQFVLVGVICHQIAQGRRWARLLLLILTLVNFANICWGIGYIWRQAPEAWYLIADPHYLLTRLLPLALKFVALHLLFFASGDWFKPRD